MTRQEWRSVNAESMERLRQEMGGKCIDCERTYSWHRGAKLPLEFSHLKPTGLTGRGRGIRNRYFDILRNRDCYALRCRYCHKIYDRNYWKNRDAHRRAEESAA